MLLIGTEQSTTSFATEQKKLQPNSQQQKLAGKNTKKTGKQLINVRRIALGRLIGAQTLYGLLIAAIAS